MQLMLRQISRFLLLPNVKHQNKCYIHCYSRNSLRPVLQNVDDAASSYRYVRDVIGSFKGNAEKFYPEFYKCVSSEEIVFKNLSRKGSVILGSEIANHVLAHLTGAIVNEGNVAFSRPVSFSSKEVSIIQYLSGYVFGTGTSGDRRIRRSNSTRSRLGVQSLRFCWLENHLWKAARLKAIRSQMRRKVFGLLHLKYLKFVLLWRQNFGSSQVK